MTPENFCYWLQGWFELNETIDHREGATQETLETIQDHLELVFDKMTIDRSKEDNKGPISTKEPIYPQPPHTILYPGVIPYPGMNPGPFDPNFPYKVTCQSGGTSGNTPVTNTKSE